MTNVTEKASTEETVITMKEISVFTDALVTLHLGRMKDILKVRLSIEDSNI